MSISPVWASVAASKNCTLLAVFAVTIRCGPPGGLLRSGIAIIYTGSKEFVCAHHPRGEALLVDVAADRLEGRPVGFETIGPEVLAELAPGFLDVIDQPRQRDAQGIGVVEAVDCEIARFYERPVDAARRPRMRTMDVLDRKSTRL